MNKPANIIEKTSIVFIQANGRVGWYYLRIENQPEKLLRRLRDQFDYDVSLAHEIVIERPRENAFHNPALQEAELFLEFLKNEISTAFEAESFLGGWYHFPEWNEAAWQTQFGSWKQKRTESLMRPAPENAATQMTLF